MPNKDYHTNDTSLGSFNGQNAAFESDTNHTSSNGEQLNDIFFSPGDPYGPNHGHIVTNSAGGVEYWRDSNGSVLFDNDKDINNLWFPSKINLALFNENLKPRNFYVNRKSQISRLSLWILLFYF